MSENAPENVLESQQETEVARTFERDARRAAAINGIFCTIGLCVASYVYFRFPHAGPIMRHDLDKSGQPISPERVELYLFVFPLFLVFATFAPLWSIPRMRRLRREGINIPKLLIQTASDETVVGNQLAFIILCFMAGAMLLATIYRSILFATSAI